jgi:leucyl/phenylalanyl-tRNA---protein transferase
MFLTPELVLTAYQQGYFPMAEPDGAMYWHCPDPRAVIPLDGVKVSRSLRKTLAKGEFRTRINTDFAGVIQQCAARRETWISDEIIEVYTELHTLGYAHSVEAWFAASDGAAEAGYEAGYERLVGGLYGVTIGGAFFGESMFSLMPDASKVAFVRLTEHLRLRNFSLLDSQYINAHMESLGAVEIRREAFLYHLKIATRQRRSFD